MKKEGLLSEKDIANILKSAHELPIINNKFQRLIEQVTWMENARDKCKVELSDLRKQVSTFKHLRALQPSQRTAYNTSSTII
jgi:hypothetical protein